MERAKLGLQHSSSTVRWTRSTQPLLWGRPDMDEAEWGAGLGHCLAELLGSKLTAVVGGDRLQLPAGLGVAPLATWCTSAEV